LGGLCVCLSSLLLYLLSRYNEYPRAERLVSTYTYMNPPLRGRGRAEYALQLVETSWSMGLGFGIELRIRREGKEGYIIGGGNVRGMYFLLLGTSVIGVYMY
jgi:hypothetical protein